MDEYISILLTIVIGIAIPAATIIANLWRRISILEVLMKEYVETLQDSTRNLREEMNKLRDGYIGIDNTIKNIYSILSNLERQLFEKKRGERP